MFGNDPAIPPDQERDRQSENSAIKFTRLRIAHHNRVDTNVMRAIMITVKLTQPLTQQRQFVAQTVRSADLRVSIGARVGP